MSLYFIVWFLLNCRLIADLLDISSFSCLFDFKTLIRCFAQGRIHFYYIAYQGWFSMHVKIAQIRSFFWSVFSRTWAEYEYVNLRIQPEHVKIRTTKNSVLGHFSRSVWFTLHHPLSDLLPNFDRTFGLQEQLFSCLCWIRPIFNSGLRLWASRNAFRICIESTPPLRFFSFYGHLEGIGGCSEL